MAIGELLFTTTVRIESKKCPVCGICYGIDETIVAKRREDGQLFFCPNGHSLSFHETEAQRLQKLLDAERAAKSREWERANREAKRAETAEKKLRRVDRGVCPHCKRSFANLRRHMECKHKDAP